MGNLQKEIILASKSPRRQELIKGLELAFEISTYEVDESFPQELKTSDIVLHLAEKKALAYPGTIGEGKVLLTADTIVWINGHVLNKPADKQESYAMLTEICGSTHEVYTGVCLRTAEKMFTFYERSEVTCKTLTEEEVWHYIHNYRPFDKAGSYGIQDWFGYTAVEKINGCFYNVMGLPVSRVYAELKRLS